ncbi:C40 family peptidase [Paenibacillus sepulcri]|uniref:C40 family peptidase n=1 Tax=Paenibacillus sepulcri TaxID=359917 RepID=A0ABS7C5J7_9BACL|nr:C40 family peptidase [Paenibacillus sepulcri]
MNKKNLFRKSIVGITLSLAVLASSTLAAPPKPVAAASATTSSTSSKIIANAKKYLGVKYQFGASTSTTKRFDCSSFTKRVLSTVGVTIPRTSKAQSKAGKYVSKSNLKVGDLVFFYSPIHHVGIYIGDGKIIHTYGAPGVTISSINSGWWKDHYETARRVL